MTFSAPSHGASARHHLGTAPPNSCPSLLVQSGETDEDVAVEVQEKPEAKPWAHFLAGG
jgi:hypothetical protein